MNLLFIFLLSMISFLQQYIAGQPRTKSRGGHGASVSQPGFIIDGNIGGLLLDGIIKLRIWYNVIDEVSPDVTPYREYDCPIRNGEFYFHIDSIDHPVYFSLYYFDKGDNVNALLSNIDLYIAEPYDSINLRTMDGSLHFSGIGSAKYNCRYKLDSLEAARISDRNLARSYKNKDKNVLREIRYNDTSFAISWINRTKSIFSDDDSLMAKKLNLLQRYQVKLLPVSYQLMKLDVISKDFIDKLYAIKAANGRIERLNSLASTIKDRKKVLWQQRGIESLYYRTFTDLSMDTVSCQIREISKNYIQLAFMRMMQNGEYSNNNGTEDYQDIKSKFKGDIRDKLLAHYFLDRFNNLEDANLLIKNASSIVKNKDCIIIIHRLGNQGQGVRSFNFKLPNAQNKLVSLKQFAGKVVVLDFWFTGCPGCSKFYKNVLSSVEDKFKDNNEVVFISISVDYSRREWLRSVAKNIYTSDARNNVINLYTNGNGIEEKVIKYYNIVTYPHPFIIGKNGLIFNSNKEDLWNLHNLTQLILNALNE